MLAIKGRALETPSGKAELYTVEAEVEDVNRLAAGEPQERVAAPRELLTPASRGPRFSRRG